MEIFGVVFVDSPEAKVFIRVSTPQFLRIRRQCVVTLADITESARCNSRRRED
jgi:hypothetical protein